MKCIFRRHDFKHRFDNIVGGLIMRHVQCSKCNLWYAISWHLQKPHRPFGKGLRYKGIV